MAELEHISDILARVLKDGMHRPIDDLTDEEQDRFIQWVWDNYKTGEDPKPHWHPLVREEWIRVQKLDKEGKK